MTTKERVNEWTISDVRQNLPRVSVLYGGRVYLGNVSGRRCQFANVWARVGGSVVEATYSWEAVTRAVNGRRSLSLGGV